MRSLTVQILQPCHERWSDMQPTEQGRFCASCQKMVVDYTAFSDQELVRLLAKAPETSCGRFRDEQLNRPLLPSNSDTTLTWRSWFGLLTMGLFGWQTARAQLNQSSPSRPASVQQTPALASYAVAKLPVRSSFGTDENWVINGQVMLMDSSGNRSPIPGANVSITVPYTDAFAERSGKIWQVQTDSTGAFTLQIPMQRQATELTIWAYAPNYHRPQRITVTALPSTKSISLNDIVLQKLSSQNSPRDITGGGLTIIRKPSRWQKFKRKLFGTH